MSTTEDRSAEVLRLWDVGQRHLVVGRYVAARRALEGAEAAAWRKRDTGLLARIYLPLLEARRQIRYNAAEGALVVVDAHSSMHEQQRVLKGFLAEPAGTIVLACAGGAARYHAACLFAGSVQYESRRTGRWLEALLLVEHGGEMRVTSMGDPTFAAGLAVKFTTDEKGVIGASTEEGLMVPLPPAGSYRKGGLHALMRESMIIAPEALALKWQHRHGPAGKMEAWEELAWLRLALRIDPACEPITMRLIALAEAMGRAGGF